MSIQRPVLPRLGVNIDHIATLRQLRGTPYPSLLEAARLVENAGGNQITVHLREDRRHIQDADVTLLRKVLHVPLNLEMSVAPEIVRYACSLKPPRACIVPEKRKEVTTEGGLDLKRGYRSVEKCVKSLCQSGVAVSLFIEPSKGAVKRSFELGAHAVEFHTGRYCLSTQGASGPRATAQARKELKRIEEAALLAFELGLEPHAGHGLDYSNVRAVTELKAADQGFLIFEYNIGHSIVCRAALVGLERAVREMLSAVTAP